VLPYTLTAFHDEGFGGLNVTVKCKQLGRAVLFHRLSQSYLVGYLSSPNHITVYKNFPMLEDFICDYVGSYDRYNDFVVADDLVPCRLGK